MVQVRVENHFGPGGEKICVGSQCGLSVWALRVGIECGRSVWALSVGTQCGQQTILGWKTLENLRFFKQTNEKHSFRLGFGGVRLPLYGNLYGLVRGTARADGRTPH